MIETYNPATGELVAAYEEHTVDEIARFGAGTQLFSRMELSLTPNVRPV